MRERTIEEMRHMRSREEANRGTALSALDERNATSDDSSSRGRDSRHDPLVRILDESYGYMRPRPHDAKLRNMCLLKTHKTASTTMGSILFRFAAVHAGRVYNREGHELKRWKSWRVNAADGDDGEKVRATGVKDIEYSMVITHFGKSTGTRNTVWLRKKKEEEEKEEEKEEVEEELKNAFNISNYDDDIVLVSNDPTAYGLVPSPESAEDQNGVEPPPTPESSDSSSGEDAPEWLPHDISLKNFTDWCRAVVTPEVTMYEHALSSSPRENALVITTLREPIGRFLSWYFFYIEPEQAYNYGANNFGGGDKSGSAAASNEEEGGMYASQGVVAEHLFTWMKKHGTLPHDLLLAEQRSNATTVELDNTFNHQAREFLLWTSEDVENFVRDATDANTWQIDFVAIADRFDESLIVLRHLANWDLRDLSYLRMLNSGADAASSSPLLRWDGLPIKNSLRARQLNSTMLEFIDANTRYDKMLYEYFDASLDARLDALRASGVNVDGELEALRNMETDLAQLCHSRGNLAAGDALGRARTPEEDRVCAFYAMDDLTYEASVDTKGVPRNVPTALQLSPL